MSACPGISELIGPKAPSCRPYTLDAPAFTLQDIDDSRDLRAQNSAPGAGTVIGYDDTTGTKVDFKLDDEGNRILILSKFLSESDRAQHIGLAAMVKRQQTGPPMFRSPRDEMMYTHNGRPYSFGGSARPTCMFTPYTRALSDKIVSALEEMVPGNPYVFADTGADLKYSSKYPRGGSIAFHADDEYLSQGKPTWGAVAVFSLGQTRVFKIATKVSQGGQKFKKGPVLYKIPLKDNSLVVMYGPTFQERYMHGVDKLPMSFKPNEIGIRLSLNIRYSAMV